MPLLYFMLSTIDLFTQWVNLLFCLIFYLNLQEFQLIFNQLHNFLNFLGDSLIFQFFKLFVHR